MADDTDEEGMNKIFGRLQKSGNVNKTSRDAILNWLTKGGQEESTPGVEQLANNLWMPFQLELELGLIERQMDSAQTVQELEDLEKDAEDTISEIGNLRVTKIQPTLNQQASTNIFKARAIKEAVESREIRREEIRQEAAFIEAQELVRQDIRGGLSAEETAFAQQVEGDIMQDIEDARSLSELERIDTSVALTKASERRLKSFINERIDEEF